MSHIELQELVDYKLHSEEFQSRRRNRIESHLFGGAAGEGCRECVDKLTSLEPKIRQKHDVEYHRGTSLSDRQFTGESRIPTSRLPALDEVDEW